MLSLGLWLKKHLSEQSFRISKLLAACYVLRAARSQGSLRLCFDKLLRCSRFLLSSSSGGGLFHIFAELEFLSQIRPRRSVVFGTTLYCRAGGAKARLSLVHWSCALASC